MTQRQLFRGLLTALPTPTQSDGSVAVESMKRLVAHQVAAGADGLVPMGGTGEFSALTPRARIDAVATVIDAAAGIPVVPGVISPGFGEAVEMGQAFRKLGAAGVMVIAPYYVRPTQQGIRDYFKAYQDAVGLPVILYDIPRFTNTLVEPETIAQMVDDGSIHGIKACNTDFNHFMKTAALAGDRMSMLSGEDRLCPLHMLLGATGGVLASATLVPGLWKEIIALSEAGKHEAALEAQKRLVPLFDAIYLETNPAPMKLALGMLGIDAGQPRLPLLPAGDATATKMAEALAAMRQDGLRLP